MAELNTRFTEATGGLVMLVVELVLLFLVFCAVIALVQATRKIPVQYARRIVGNKQYGGVRQYIPLKINAAGVMPIIFAQALMFIPMFFTRFEATRGFAAAFADYTGFWYNLVFALLEIAFTYFYTAITVNPNMMAEDMKRNGGFIPGVKPGKKTVEYLDTIMTRITLPGSIFLAIVAILPTFAMKLGINNQFALFYGGTSLLILVGVVLDTLQQIESYLLRHYGRTGETGRIKARQLLRVLKMIYLKTAEEIELLRENNLLVSATLAEVGKYVRPGVSTLELDKLAEEFIRSHGAEPGFLGYGGFPNTLCMSVTKRSCMEQFPAKRILKGDVLSVTAVRL